MTNDIMAMAMMGKLVRHAADVSILGNQIHLSQKFLALNS